MFSFAIQGCLMSSGTAAPAWTPDDLVAELGADLKRLWWFDAAHVTKDGGNIVSTVADVGPLGRDGTPWAGSSIDWVDADPEFNGRPVLYFAGGTESIDASWSSEAQPYTLIHIYRSADTTSFFWDTPATEIGLLAGGAAGLYTASATQTATSWGGQLIGVGSSPWGNRRQMFDLHLISQVMNGASSKVRIDGAQVWTGNSGTTGVDGMRLGARKGATPNNPMIGEIALSLHVNGALSDVDVAALEAKLAAYFMPPLLVVDGDSIYKGPPYVTSEEVWPRYLQTHTALFGNSNIGFRNIALGGRTAQQIAAAVSTSSVPFFAPVRAACFAANGAGINDYYAGRTGAQVYADLGTWATAMDAAGFICIVDTSTPYTALSAPQEAERVDGNARILANASVYPYHVLDVDSGSDPNWQDPTDGTWFTVDELHRTAASHAVLAARMGAKMLELMP